MLTDWLHLPRQNGKGPQQRSSLGTPYPRQESCQYYFHHLLDNHQESSTFPLESITTLDVSWCSFLILCQNLPAHKLHTPSLALPFRSHLYRAGLPGKTSAVQRKRPYYTRCVSVPGKTPRNLFSIPPPTWCWPVYCSLDTSHHLPLSSLVGAQH